MIIYLISRLHLLLYYHMQWSLVAPRTSKQQIADQHHPNHSPPQHTSRQKGPPDPHPQEHLCQIKGIAQFAQKGTFKPLADLKQKPLWKLAPPTPLRWYAGTATKAATPKSFLHPSYKPLVTVWQCPLTSFMRQTLTDDFLGYTKIWIACFLYLKSSPVLFEKISSFVCILFKNEY